MTRTKDFKISTQYIEQHFSELQALRREVHRYPETALDEHNTAERVASFLEKTGADHIATGIGGTGIIATYQGEKPGPTIMFRAELDGLPIQEHPKVQKAYRSEYNGKMHACGHDGHLTMVAGIGAVLKDLKPEKGTVKLLFQPAEETGEGALKMLQDEDFKQHEPDLMFGLHNLPGYPMHQVVVREGIFASASVGVKIYLDGATSHAAHPEEGRSPAQAVSQLIPMIESLPHRSTSINEAAKATVIHAVLGEKAFGTSPGKAVVMATLRSYRDETLESMKEHVQREAHAIAEVGRLSCNIEWAEPFSATTADSDAVDCIRIAANHNEFDLTEAEKPFAWSEDFGQFTDRFPGAFFGLGSGIDQPPLHASIYDFPDELISTGVRLFLSIIAQQNGLSERN